MKRRTLLQLSSLSAAAAALPWVAGSFAQSGSYGGPYWIFVTANGGWDPRFLFDPTLNPEQNTLYTEIGKIGNISFAPIDATPGELGVETVDAFLNPERFLQKFGSRLTVFNGVDTSTNNHDSGQRAFASGSLLEGMPALGAMLAGTHGVDRPLPFISFGGYDATYGIAPLSRLGSSRVLQNLAEPNAIRPNEEEALYHTPETYARMRALQTQSLSNQMAAQRLPRLLRSQRSLSEARLTDDQLKALVVPELTDLPGGLGRAEDMLRAGQLAVATFKAGLGVAANLSIGGFDTHGNHNEAQRLSLLQLLTGVGGLVDYIDAEGMADKVVIVVGSDFGRTPHYNAGNGKDHWSITSYFALGAGIAGDRVVGGTTDDQTPLNIDPATLQTVASGGTRLTPEQIHSSLRQMGNLSETLLTEYPVVGDALPLFG